MKKYRNKGDGWLHITRRLMVMEMRKIKEDPGELTKRTREIRRAAIEALQADANPCDPRCDTICPEGKDDLRRIALKADAILEGREPGWGE